MKRGFTALVTVAGMAGALAVALPAAAATTTCRVVDTSTDQSYSTLQAGVTAATAGDTLFVKGICKGSTTISKSLTLTGQSTASTKTATLDGAHAGAVLVIYGQDASLHVTLNKLVITNGSYSGISIGGATVTLNGSTVTGNKAGPGLGGGIWNDFGGTLTLNNSTVSGNDAGPSAGGGIFNDMLGTLILNHSTVSGNTAAIGGGIFSSANASVTMENGSTVTGNSLNSDDTYYTQHVGGGIYNLCGPLTGAVAGGNVYDNHPDNIYSSC